MADVTGFGLLGHLAEMCEGSGVSAVVKFDKVPVIDGLGHYLDQQCFPGGTARNWNSYGSKVRLLSGEQQYILADPQTSGGLLVAVLEERAFEFEERLRASGLPEKYCHAFGYLKRRENGLLITVV